MYPGIGWFAFDVDVRRAIEDTQGFFLARFLIVSGVQVLWKSLAGQQDQYRDPQLWAAQDINKGKSFLEEMSEAKIVDLKLLPFLFGQRKAGFPDQVRSLSLSFIHMDIICH